MIKNAIIEEASIGIERGFMLDSWLYLDYGGSGQGFGGYCLHKQDVGVRDTLGYAGHWILRCLEIAGVEKWKDMKGKTIRVQLDSDGFGGNIEAIGHIVKDDWFNPSKDFEEAKDELE